METRTSSAELRQVERHRVNLSRERGCDVSFEEARSDWEGRYAAQWRIERQAAILRMQREEIERHKWIESEKCGHDLGRQAALDWINKYAAHWRDWYETEFEPVREVVGK